MSFIYKTFNYEYRCYVEDLNKIIMQHNKNFNDIKQEILNSNLYTKHQIKMLKLLYKPYEE